MRVNCFVLILGFVAAAALPAQELGVFATNSRPGPWKDVAAGGGVSAAAFMRLGSVFAETNALSRADMHIGLRVAVSESRGSLYTAWWCGSECGAQEPRIVRTRLRITQYALLILPYRSRFTRVEMGAGIVSHAFSGDVSANIPAWMATVGASRRFVRRLPLWATLGYDYQRRLLESYQVWPQDGMSAATPTHVVRFGLLVRR